MKSPLTYEQRLMAERLSELRNKRGWTQQDAANESNNLKDPVTLDDIRRYESLAQSKHSDPPLTKLVTLADMYDVDTDYLLGRTDSPRQAETAAAKEIGTNEEVIQTLKRVAKHYAPVFAKCVCAGGEHWTVLDVFCRNATMLETINAETILAITGGTQLFKNRYQILKGLEAIKASAQEDGDLHFLTNAAIELENGHATVLFKLSKTITNLMESIYPSPEYMIRSQVHPMLNSLGVDPNTTIDDAMVKHGRKVLDEVLEKIGNMKLSDLMPEDA